MRQYEIGPGIDLGLEVHHLLFDAATGRMALGMTGDGNAKVRSVQFSYQLDQIDGPCALTPAHIILFPPHLASRWITPQRQYVAHPARLGLVQMHDQLLPRQPRAREVHQYVDAAESLGVRGHGQGPDGGGTGLAPGDVDEEGIEAVGHAIDAGEEIVEAGFRFGGEEFKGVKEGWGGGVGAVVGVGVVIMGRCRGGACYCGGRGGGQPAKSSLSLPPPFADPIDDSAHANCRLAVVDSSGAICKFERAYLSRDMII